jgi:hypothetical protein
MSFMPDNHAVSFLTESMILIPAEKETIGRTQLVRYAENALFMILSIRIT